MYIWNCVHSVVENTTTSHTNSLWKLHIDTKTTLAKYPYTQTHWWENHPSSLLALPNTLHDIALDPKKKCSTTEVSPSTRDGFSWLFTMQWNGVLNGLDWTGGRKAVQCMTMFQSNIVLSHRRNEPLFACSSPSSYISCRAIRYRRFRLPVNLKCVATLCSYIQSGFYTHCIRCVFPWLCVLSDGFLVDRSLFSVSPMIL